MRKLFGHALLLTAILTFPMAGIADKQLQNPALEGNSTQTMESGSHAVTKTTSNATAKAAPVTAPVTALATAPTASHKTDEGATTENKALASELQMGGAKVSETKQAKPDQKEQLKGQSEENKTLFLDMFFLKVQTISDWSGFEFWRISYFGCGFLLAICLSTLIFWIIRKNLILGLFFDREKEWMKVISNGLAFPVPAIVFLSVTYCSALPMILELPHTVFVAVDRILFALLALLVTIALFNLETLLEHYLLRLLPNADHGVNTLVIGVIGKLIKVCFLLIALMLIAENVLSMNVSALLAGAGVIGLAVAFAARETIANFFGSLVIIIDRSFKVGDFIRVEPYAGVVQKLGLRSTILRTLDGHLITVPNKITANSALVNVSERPYIRQAVNIGLVYDTTQEKMERAIAILHEILDHHEGMNAEFPPRIHFNAFNDYSMNIEVITWYHPGDYFLNADFWHRTNLKILARFNEEGLDFAFPTNTTYLAYDPKHKFPASPVTRENP